MELEAQGSKLSNKLNNLYHRINKLLNSGKFLEVEEIIKNIVVEDLDPRELIAYLIITRQAHEKYYDTYSKFYNDVYDILDIIGENPKENLFGLKPKEIINE